MNLAFLSTAHIHAEGFIDIVRHADDGRKTLLVWDDVPDRGRRHAERAGATFEPDLAKVLADARVDGFIVCSETTKHLPLLRQALPLGKPILCDKPFLTRTEELPELRALQARHGGILISGYFQPFTAEMQAARGLIEAGAFGRILRVAYRNSHHAALGRWFDRPDLQWFTDPAIAGGGAFVDMGTHGIHLLRSFFGPVEAVWAEIGNQTGIYPGVDDFGIVLLRFASGLLGRVEASWTQTGGPRGLEIAGTEKSLWSETRGYFTGGDPEPLLVGREVPGRVDRLVAAARGKIPPGDLAADLEACFDAVTIVEAAYRSAREKAWVSLP